MKTFALVSAVLLTVAFSCANAESFLEDYKQLTDSLLAPNQTTMDILSIKINSLYQATNNYGVNRRVYQNTFNVINAYRAFSDVLKPSRLDFISNIQDSFDIIFDQLNLQRDVDEIHLPSEINKQIDEFVERYSLESVEIFDNMFTQSQYLEGAIEKLSGNSSDLVDHFAESIEKCLLISKSEFKNVYECRENAREDLPPLAHNLVLLKAAASDLSQLDLLRMDGKKSISQLLIEITREKYRLMNLIDEMRIKREAEKDQKSSESSEEETE